MASPPASARVRWGTVRLAALALAVGLILGLIAPRLLAAGAGESGSLRAHRHVVRQGETLWQLAGDYGKDDPRRFVYEVSKLNGLEGAAIYPGQNLVIP